MKHLPHNPAQQSAVRGFRGRKSLPPAPRVYPARIRDRLVPLHQELRKVIPSLLGSLPLSSSILDDDFRTACQQSKAQDFKFWYLEANLMKRYFGVDLSDPGVRLASALAKLRDSEVKCAETNRVFAGGLDFSNSLIPVELLSVLLRARKYVGAILGRFPIEALPSACDFSPGATTEFPRRRAALHNKWARATHVTSRARPYVEAFQRWTGLPDLPRPLVVEECNHVFTVPKNFERDRTACKPVTWNGFLQKGVGTLIRRRAQRVKRLLLPDAQDYHRVLAKLGSATGLLATRDLASASDCISIGLVEALVPADWFKILMDLREPLGVLPDTGETVVWEKISSMGNGYTFELETVLFYALVLACCKKDSLVSAYGDDLIFPTPYVDLVDEVLTFCGFEVNREKSFSTGKFRESCGGHYFDGVDVKPFYLQHLPSTLGDVINLHNDIVRWHGGTPRPGTRWFKTWSLCRQVVPRDFWGPAPAQGVLWAEWDDSRPTYVPPYQSWRVAVVTRAFDPRQSLDLSEDVGAYFQKLWCADPDPWESSAPSTYRVTGTRERNSWLFVDACQWKRLATETLCN